MVPSASDAPMLLTGVCRRWREVSRGTPSLWCKLSLRVDPEEEWEQRALGYDSWLKLSRGYPLSLALECYDDEWTHLQSLLQPYVDQISSLYINIGYLACKPELLLTGLSALQELTMCTSGGVDLAQLIRQLPSSLRSLHVIRFHQDALLFDHALVSSCNPIWSHLTNVTIDTHQSNAVFHLLQLAPSLSSLAICISFPKKEVLEPFTHTKLQCLRIKGRAPQTWLSDLLNALSLPNLLTLEVYDFPAWPHQELKAFLAQSGRHLETLLLGSGVRITNELQAEYTALIPSLKIVADPSWEGVFGPFDQYITHLD
ncbi:hypothetical protein BDR07DRAFT_1383191 [Suillus spraguei]|nr:hypothetical protein BDR07DRAFT_1383191 [Suillus spraguei]